jgi:hypothetical protein
MSTSSGTQETGGDQSSSNKESEATHRLSKDTIFHLLQVQRRRYALQYLQGTTEPVVMRDLAEQVAVWEYGTPIENLQSKERQRTYISLYQSHLPKLDKERVIEHDQTQGLVTRTDTATQLDSYLRACQTQPTGTPGDEEANSQTSADQPWIQWYSSGVLVSCCLLSMSVLNIPIGVPMSDQLVLTVIVLLFTLITVAYHMNQ